MSSISFKNINKIYSNGFHAVKDFNLEIDDGEFIVFVGPSGCGKSTTLRMLAGLEDISSGKLKIDEKIVNDTDPSKRDIAMVFQNYALYPHMTVYKNMEYALKNKKVPKEERDKKIKAAAELLQIEEYIDRKPGQLSGGQNQRVALGRAIVRNPRVFLMDEPLSNLDAKLRSHMRTEIKKIHKQLDTTFVYVTHDQTEAMTLGDRIVVMKDGIIQQIDTPTNLYDNPVNLFVAGFIGTPKINVLKLQVYEKNGEKKLGLNGLYIKLSDEINSILKKYDKKEIYVATRAENLFLDNDNNLNSKFEIEVEITENLGSETLIYGKIADNEVIVKDYNKNYFEQRNILKVYFDSNKLLFFDVDTEERLY